MAEAEAVQLKEEGNRHFQLQDYKAAAKSYSQALKLTKDKALLATLYRNRAACGLKTESYAQAASDASRAIDINSSDIKALYRRSQALEHLGELAQAFKDVQCCATLEPQNPNFQETLRRLNASIQEKLRVQYSTDSRVQNMFEILLDGNSEADKLEKVGAGPAAGALGTCQVTVLPLQTLLLCLGDTKKDRKQITNHLLDMLVSKKVSGQGRDQALNLLSKNVPRKDLAIHDNSRTIYVVDNGLRKILKVVGQVPDLPSCLPLTDNTRMLASILINKLYDDLRWILQGPFDLGNQLLGLKGVMEMMVALCSSERETDQLVAVEALIHASTKLSRATFIITNGVWLCNTSTDTQTQRWAVEGLAYLTLDADVKDDFVQDIPALQAMLELAKASTPDKTILYSVATTLVNCTNSYDVKEVIPELVQLAKFSKQHVPEEHPKDKKDFVDKRVNRLLKAGVISALACMVKADNAILTDQTKELLARVFLALCDNPKDRGTIVAQGGGKALIPLALEGTDVGKVKAAHALAKIAAVSNPDIAFPGERVYEVVRPLVRLLDTQRDGLQNYEALLGLTNLSARSDKLRQKIFKEKALPDIENYMFENHDQLRQAATECMCNMVVSKEVQERFLADGNDRLKLVVLLCGEDDDKLQNAAAGALAMLTAAHKKLCFKMTQVTTQWLEILQRLCLHDRLSVQHRGLVIAYNLVAADAELAKKLVESELMEILTVVGKQEPDEKRAAVVQTARECLIKCIDYGFIKPVS
eukprot:bmy_02908T0